VNVLIVDDNTEAADLLAELLADDYVVRTTHSGTQALKAVNEERFDVALVDIMLPDVPGVDLAEELRARSPALVMIAISGSSLDELRAHQGARANFSHFLQKPIDFEQLAGLLSGLSPND